MRLSIAMGLLASLLIGADAPRRDTPKAQDGLQGAWKLTAGEADGKALPADQLKDGKLVIKGGDYTVTLGDKTIVTGTQELGPTKKAQDDRHHGRQWSQQRQNLPGHL